MKHFKDIFNNFDKTDLKIIKIGIKFCFGILIIGIILLFSYLILHNLFLYDLGIAIIKLSTYMAVEFIVCGIVADFLKKQVNP